MEADVFDSSLGTHKLSGKLDGLQSCSCGYDCRIVFSIEQNIESEPGVAFGQKSTVNGAMDLPNAAPLPHALSAAARHANANRLIHV